MAGNSNVTIQMISDDASTFGDLAPTLATGGFSDQPSLSMSNDVIAAMLLGGPDGQPFNWKWNRLNVPNFFTNSWQQDYFVPGVVNVGWLETAYAFNINQTSQPKSNFVLEVHRDLDIEWAQTGIAAKICWEPNYTLQTGTWGASTAVMPLGLTNPGPNVVYTNPLGLPSQPINPITQITDPKGNLWVLTTYGTCGAVEPTWPDVVNVVYPTYNDPSLVASTVTDGSVVWTAINPNGQGFRITPLPPQTGTTWQIQPVAQMRVPLFTSLDQTLDPVPDDYATYFKQGFFCQCIRRSPDAKTRARFQQEFSLWMQSLDKAVKQGQREKDDFGFYPERSIMDTGYAVWIGPANPYNYGPFNQ